MWRRLFFFLALPIAILVVAFLSVQPASFDVTLLSSSSSFSWMRAPSCIRSLSLDRLFNSFLRQQQRDISTSTSKMASAGPSSTSYRTPVYFLSHGGPDVQYRTEHPVYPVLQAIGKEITTRVKPKAVVVFSAHWQSPSADEIHLNNAVTQPLIYDFYNFPPHFYKATFPSTGSPQLAARIQSLLASHSQPIKTHALPRGLDHGVFSGFNVAFSPKTNPLNVPLVQVSLFNSEDPQSHYALGEAVCALRSEGVVIICTGMSVHNLRDMRFTRPDGPPLPYVVSFDNALKEAVEASPPKVRREKMVEAAARPDARQAHPWMDHLMPLYVAAGAAGEEDLGKQTWTKHEGSFAWAQYRFGELPPLEN